jgi:hypothetical protein
MATSPQLPRQRLRSILVSDKSAKVVLIIRRGFFRRCGHQIIDPFSTPSGDAN